MKGKGNIIHAVKKRVIKILRPGPGRVALLVRVLGQYAKVEGSILCQGPDKNQPMNA